MKVVLAYSGGLDTSVIVPWLRETYAADVVCFVADVGQADELDGLEERALASGACEFHSLDLKRELVESFILPTLRAGAVYARKYLLGTAMARPLIAAHQVRIARATGAHALAHGCTGKGNDQVRFELAYAALAPDLEVIAPWREWTLRSREDALAYATARGLRLSVTPDKLYSRDRNVWHVSHEGGALEDPAWEPEESLYLLTAAPEDAPRSAEHVEIEFEDGTPVAVNGAPAAALSILEELNARAARHGVGRADIVEDRLVGMKSRGVYETPGGTVLHIALRELEQLVLDRRSLALKDRLAARYADLVYEGRWWGSEREALDAAVGALARRLSGRVRLKLYKGSATVSGRWSPHSLYDEGLATFGDGGAYRQSDATGFIRLFSLPYVGAGNGLAAPLRAKTSDGHGGMSHGPAVTDGKAASSDRELGPAGRSADHRPPRLTPPHRMGAHPGGTEPAPEFDRLNRSLPVDGRLWKEDVRGSRAWALALEEAGVLDENEAALLLAGLERVAHLIPAALASAPADEDIHSLVERLLYEEVGDVAGKLHTGRSRNDQVATDTRLWSLSACSEMEREVARVQSALVELAERQGALLMPGYTHLRRAQPLRAGHWLLSHFWRLERDRDRLSLAQRRASVMPLGSGALAGCPFPVDRPRLAERLGFRRVSTNSLDAVSDRDWACEILFALALLGSHLSGLAEDLILFSSAEFGFVNLDDRVTSGSSLMPQKRNPDALELARAQAGGWLGDLTAMLSVLKGLPSGYNKDLQEDKAILFRAVDAARDVLPAVALVVETLELDEERMRQALDEGMLATDLADQWVERGVPFREAHARVGALVAEAERRGLPLSRVAREEDDLGHLEGTLEGHPGHLEGTLEDRPGHLEEASDLYAAFEASADRRQTPGGTGLRALEEQTRLARAALGTVRA